MELVPLPTLNRAYSPRRYPSQRAEMDFLDFSNQQEQKSDESISRPVYYENIIKQLNFNPAILVFALTLYVLLLLLGILSNARVVSIIRKRINRNSFTFDARLIELDIFSLCCSNLLSILCFTFVIFDLAYGQWMIPSKIFCRLYLSMEGLTRIVSGLTLAHLAVLCSYFVRKMRKIVSSNVSFGFFAKISIHYLYLLIFSPLVALVFAVILFQHGDVRFSPTEPFGDDFSNETDLVTVAKCVLSTSNRMSTFLTIFGSICGYLIPIVAFLISAILCECRCKNISDPSIRRYVLMSTNYGLLFFFCHTPAWVISVYDYVRSIFEIRSPDSNDHAAAFVSYFAHTLTYFTCVGYPILFLRGMNKNRISTDASAESIAVGRDETGASLTSGQQFIGRDVSRDILLTNRQAMRGRSRTMSSLQVANMESIISIASDRHSSYQTLSDGREEEDQF